MDKVLKSPGRIGNWLAIAVSWALMVGAVLFGSVAAGLGAVGLSVIATSIATNLPNLIIFSLTTIVAMTVITLGTVLRFHKQKVKLAEARAKAEQDVKAAMAAAEASKALKAPKAKAAKKVYSAPD